MWYEYYFGPDHTETTPARVPITSIKRTSFLEKTQRDIRGVGQARETGDTLYTLMLAFSSRIAVV